VVTCCVVPTLFRLKNAQNLKKISFMAIRNEVAEIDVFDAGRPERGQKSYPQ